MALGAGCVTADVVGWCIVLYADKIAHKERTVYPVGMTSLLRKDGDIFGARKRILFQTVDGKHSVHFSSVESLSCFRLFVTP